MSFTLKVSKDLKRLLKPTQRNGLINQVKKEFAKRGPVKVKQAIVQDMIKGVSPVKGEGKWKRYSKSYKQQIKGKVRFFTKGGKVIAIKAARGKRISNSVTENANPTKQISPVNLKLSGDLHKSLKSFIAGLALKSFTLVISFDHFLADIHNRRGAGKIKQVRRMLPTKNGEEFNRRISLVILNQLKNAVGKVAKRFNRQ